MKKIKGLIVLLTASMLVACSGSEDPATADAGQADQAATPGASEVSGATTRSALPLPDPNHPLSAYTETDSGTQLGYQFYAASNTPFDHALFASHTRADYMSERDEFAKNDMVEQAKPEMDRELAEAKANPYRWMSIGKRTMLLDAYDFERKGFPIKEFTEVENRSFNDSHKYAIRWVNRDQVAFAPVPDQDVARQIEAYRTGKVQRSMLGANPSPNPLLKIYYFVQSATSAEGQFGSNYVNGWVSRVQITDPDGKVLAEYTPDGNVAVSDTGQDEDACRGSVVDCVGQEFGF